MVAASADLRYPCAPPTGYQSGRQIDDEHWRKVQDIFPVEHYDKDDELKLHDESKLYSSISILDGRQENPNMDKQGFTLVENCSSEVSDFSDESKVRALYLEKEVVSIVHNAFSSSSTPPKHIIPFHWLIRDSRRDNYDSSQGPQTFQGSSHAPVSRVHGDYTNENGPLRFEELQALGLLDRGLDKHKVHWGIVNVWKNIDPEHVVSRKPLALLDVSSLVDSDDIFQYWLVNQTKIGRNLAVTYQPTHRWMYFPNLSNTEAIAFFTFEMNGGTRRVFHSAFDDPSATTTMSHPRVSLETRCLVVF